MGRGALLPSSSLFFFLSSSSFFNIVRTRNQVETHQSPLSKDWFVIKVIYLFFLLSFGP